MKGGPYIPKLPAMRNTSNYLAILATLLLLGGVEASHAQSYDDLYYTAESPKKADKKKEKEKNTADAPAATATATTATASTATTENTGALVELPKPKTLSEAESYVKNLEQEFYGTENHPSQPTAVVATDYDTAMQNRINGMSSSTYQKPASYYELQYSDTYKYAKTYDPEYYNVMVSGDQVWVEPKYITSMFGTWGAAVVIEVHHWYYGWDDPYYYYWWGYPHYSWVDWYWGFSYDPFWGWGFSWGWGWPGWRPYGPWGPHPWGPRPWGPRPYYPPGGHIPGPRPACPGYVHHTPAYVSPSQRGGYTYGRGSSGGGRGGTNATYGRGGTYSSSNNNVNNNVSRGYTGGKGSERQYRNNGYSQQGNGRSGHTGQNYNGPSSRGSNYSSYNSGSFSRGGYGGGGHYGGGGGFGGGHMGGGRGGRR